MKCRAQLSEVVLSLLKYVNFLLSLDSGTLFVYTIAYTIEKYFYELATLYFVFI